MHRWAYYRNLGQATGSHPSYSTPRTNARGKAELRGGGARPGNGRQIRAIGALGAGWRDRPARGGGITMQGIEEGRRV